MLRLGVAYYPDYLAEGELARLPDGRILPLGVEARIAVDLDRMRADGISTLRVGEFSWSHVEPTPGKTVTERFLLTLDLAKSRGLSVIFCTPTATPPKWLVDLYPEILPKTRQGSVIPFGSRRHYDVLNTDYQNEAARITGIYGEAFGNHPAVVGWQIDNEFGHHGSAYSFTDSALATFRLWLRRRFNDDIATLNAAWFTCFWSQGYRDFDEVPLPLASWSDQNPQLELDYRRFMSEAFAGFQRLQAEILRRKSPGRLITHNFYPMGFDLCPWRMSEDLDVVGYDHYQVSARPDPVQSAAQFNLMRSLKRGRFLVLEQQPVQVNWQPVNRRYELDWLFLWGMQAALHGAEAMYYFSWQRFAGGPEQYHDAIVPHDVRVPRSQQERVIGAKLEFCRELASYLRLAALPLPRRDVLIIQNTESFWAHDICAQSTLWSGSREVERFQRLCSASGLGVDLAERLTDVALAQYCVVVLPGYAFVLTDEERQVLRAFLDAGGKVISSPRTGFKEKTNQMSPLPLHLDDDGDFYFEDYGALAADEVETVRTVGTKKKTFRGELWAERIVIPVGSPWQVVARFGAGLYHEAPAMILRHYRQGGAHLHLAFCPELADEFAQTLWECLGLGLEARTTLARGADGVQLIPLADGTRQLLAAINFSHQPAAVEILPQRAACGFKLIEAHCAADLTLKMVKRQQLAADGAATVQLAGRCVTILEMI